MTEEKIYQITVLRQKGWPIRSAYEHTVEIRPHPPVTFEGRCLVLESDFHPDLWKEILRRRNVLMVESYIEPEERAPAVAIVAAADRTRKAIDAGAFSKPHPVTQTPTPPPKFLRMATPIRAPEAMPEMGPEAKKRELEVMVGTPTPSLTDAITGQPVMPPEAEPTVQGKRKR